MVDVKCKLTATLKLIIPQSGNLISSLSSAWFLQSLRFLQLPFHSLTHNGTKKKPTNTTIVKYRQYFQICDRMTFKVRSDCMMLDFCHDNWAQVNCLYSNSEPFNGTRSNCVRDDFFLPSKALAKDSIIATLQTLRIK